MPMLQLASTLSAGFVDAFISAAEVAPCEREALLLQSGISPASFQEARVRVTAEQFVKLYRLLVVKLDDELPNMLSHPLRSGAMKLAALCVIDAPNIEVVLNRYSRLQRLIMHDFKMHFMREADAGVLLIQECDAGQRCKPMAIELNLKVIHGFASWLAAREIPLVRIDFAFDRPAYADDLLNFFPGPAFFGQPCNRLVFDLRQLSLRVQRHAGDLRDYLATLPRDWMFLRMNERLASHQVRVYLLHHGLDGAHVEQVARALNISVRTLCRRLEEENTSFQQVKDDVRRDIAIDRLTNSDAPLARIAAELGFGDVSSFHRAFRGWTGMTPKAYRSATVGQA
ncbi:MAG TPA: AraC family transcriptional regulator ligand-binding domain-containing protein [Noviherbaspirillum sp.]